MTREKQIEEFANSQVDCEFFDDSLYKGIIIDAKWADEHPKRYSQEELCGIQLEMMKQRDKRLIKKVCEWIKENIDTYAKVVINPKSHYPEIVMCDTFEKNFKKAMGL